MINNMDQNILRINFDSLSAEFGRDGVTYLWEGKPFTGIAFEEDTEGDLISETSYVNGIQDGFEKRWFSEDRQESYCEIKFNRPHGAFVYWYPSGKIKLEGKSELGSVLFSRKYDETGNLIEEYKIEDNPKHLEDLERERKIFKDYGLI